MFLRRLFGRRGGESQSFVDFVDGSVEGLQLQTTMHSGAWHLGEEKHWSVDQELGQIVFTFPEMVVRAPVQVVGTLDTKAGTWMWAWANSSVAETLRRDSMRVRAYGESHGIRRLVDATWPAVELDGWRMTALAARLAGSNGAYRGPMGMTYIFMTFGEVSLKKTA